MPTAERSVTINRPAADVFAYVADGSKATEWRSGVAESTKESGEGKGAIYKQRIRGPLRRKVKADYEITTYDQNKKIEFKTITGPVRPTGGYRFSESDGKTKVTFWLKADLGRLKRLLMGRSVQKSMDAEMKALDKLKQVLESSGTAGTALGGAKAAAKSATKALTPKPSKAGVARSGSRASSTEKHAAKPTPARTARRRTKAS